MARYLVLLVAAAISLSGCVFGSRAEELAALQRAAPRLLQIAPTEESIPPGQWPPAVKALHPESVHSRPDGIYIVTSSFFVEEKGLFLPRSLDFIPKPGGDPEYTLIVSGLYSYVIRG